MVMNEPNPYAPPNESPPSLGLDWSRADLTRQEVTAFVGRKAGYYLNRWAGALEGTGKSSGFKWAAFFFSGLWLPYRKMYAITAIFLGFILLESLLEEVVFVEVLGRPEPPAGLGQAVGLAASIICGRWGNQWYLSRTRRAVAELRSQELAEDVYLDALGRRGGTNIAASLGFFALFIVASYGFVFALELLFQGA
jgi:hypothetical protein